jgi:predicted DNA-binding transcriptional regulator YafY
MSHTTTRVLAALELLQTHGRMSGSELARRLEVDPRTVRRYIVVLEELGIPITAERGRDGAYMLVAGFKLPPMMFSDEEALALSIGLLAARGLGLPEASIAATSAQAKLERVMPARLKHRVRALGETVTLGLARPTALVDDSALAALSDAAQSETRVSMRYRARDGEESERDFDPYGLAYRSGRWYVVGMCHLRGGLRSFRLDRVEAVHPLTVRFPRPAGFDALGHLTHSVATLPRAFTVEVLLSTDLKTAQRELFPAAGILEWTGDGVRLRAEVDDLHWFARELARLPFAFQVYQPAALLDAVRTLAGELFRLADTTDIASSPSA